MAAASVSALSRPHRIGDTRRTYGRRRVGISTATNMRGAPVPTMFDLLLSDRILAKVRAGLVITRAATEGMQDKSRDVRLCQM